MRAVFIPIGTDAPIYYRPYVTIGLIAANFAAFVHTAGGEAAEGWILTFGNGLHPSEWLKSAFLHFGFGHLVGNMIFLYTFGLIIEGKLGPLRFLGLYLALCLLGGLVGQVLMLHYTGLAPGAGGASGVIFALMAIAWLWAPRNSVEVLFLFFIIYINTFEVSLQTVALFYIGTNLMSAWLIGFEISTPVLHLLGAGVGFGAGVLMLKKNWVDCEGWDLLSLRGRPYPEPAEPANLDRPARKRRTSDELDPRLKLHQIEEQISQGQYDEAWRAYSVLRNSIRPARLPQSQLECLLKGMVRLAQWNAAVSLLEEMLERFDQVDVKHRLALAAILTRQLQRPRAAIKVLKAIPRQDLDASSAQRFQDIRQEAMQQIEDGVLELREPG
jgi:membrane associated rhomboid family serine protease